MINGIEISTVKIVSTNVSGIVKIRKYPIERLLAHACYGKTHCKAI